MRKRLLRKSSPASSRALTVSILAAASSAALGQGGLPDAIPAPPDSVRFGFAVASGGDADGDGHDDIFIIDDRYEDASGARVGKWYMFSGRTRELL